MDNMQRVKNFKVSLSYTFPHSPGIYVDEEMERLEDGGCHQGNRIFQTSQGGCTCRLTEAVKAWIRPAQDLKWRRGMCTESHL